MYISLSSILVLEFVLSSVYCWVYTRMKLGRFNCINLFNANSKDFLWDELAYSDVWFWDVNYDIKLKVDAKIICVSHMFRKSLLQSNFLDYVFVICKMIREIHFCTFIVLLKNTSCLSTYFIWVAKSTDTKKPKLVINFFKKPNHQKSFNFT
jgi:hypothetical protein